MRNNHCGECGEGARMRHPGGDPENGPARPTCPAGHSTCERCGDWFNGVGHCAPCQDQLLEEEHAAGGYDPYEGHDFGPPECAICGHPVDDDEAELRTVDLDPGDPEVGPRPDVQVCLVHRRGCCPRRKAWED